MRTVASDKGLELRAEIDPTVPPGIFGDGSRLRQILLNLLGNAVKFTEEGAIVLTVDAHRRARTRTRSSSTSACATRASASRPSGCTDFSSSFSQADASISRRYGGTGLGLAISKRLAELMGGTMWAESDGEGRGSTFHLTLTGRPAAAADLPSAAGDKGKLDLDPEQAERHPLRILVAEDNIVNQKLALRLLRAMGYEADVAANGLEAIEAVERQPYDIVLMDMQMPEMDGLEATRVIHERLAPEQRPRIVAMTANVTDEDRREADRGRHGRLRDEADPHPGSGRSATRDACDVLSDLPGDDARYASPSRPRENAGVAKLVIRARLKIGCPSGRLGSSPSPGM